MLGLKYVRHDPGRWGCSLIIIVICLVLSLAVAMKGIGFIADLTMFFANGG